MNDTLPPRSIERCLLLLLPAQDREAISGDLIEEYREHKLPRLGRLRANLWYAWQVASFVPRSPRLDVAERRVLALLCCFTALAGSWLGFMDVYLRHPNIASHEAIAGTIVAQACLTLLALHFRGVSPFRVVALLGCLAIAYLAAKAFIGLMTTADFEGYIALIALALACQAILTLLTLSRTPPPPLRAGR